MRLCRNPTQGRNKKGGIEDANETDQQTCGNLPDVT